MKSKRIDFPLTIAVVLLVAFGAVMVYSASSYTAQVQYGNKYFYLQKQIIGGILGIAVLFITSFFDYHKLAKLKYPILIVAIILLLLVFVPGIGVENYGARRWINLPFFTLQASEVAKFAFIIFASAYMSKNYEKMRTIKGVLPVLLVGGIICALIIAEPNMSVTVCVGALMFFMLFIGGIKIKHVLSLGSPCLLAIPALIIAEPYRLKRLTAFLDPWQSPLAEGYQLIQSYYALGAGGVWGVGLFNSKQKYLFLPFAESDFIFSVIGEELGLVGCALIIAVFVLVVTRIFIIAKNASDRLGGYLSAGIGCLIGLQVIINIAVVTGSIPPTGIPLPFVSAGTSSIVMFCASIGVVNNVRIQSKAIK